MPTIEPSRRLFLMGASSLLALSQLTSPARAAVIVEADPFIENLIASMSLEEKAGQLSLFGDSFRSNFVQVNPAVKAKAKDDVLAEIKAGQITGLFNGTGVEGARELQKFAVENSPHKIPLIFAGDIIHGLSTVFPIPLAEACAFDPDLARRTARAAAVEATAVGLHWTFAPMVDIARDERWGRVSEGAGEDVFLGKALAAARVEGFQGDDLTRNDSLLATPKHFAAYGAVMGGMEYNTADIPETTLRQTHLPPFKAAFDAGALTTMSSFNDIAGVPSTGNAYLLTHILREEWGFKGLVVSDYTSEEELIAHGFAADGRDAAKKALSAGCDISMQSGIYNKYVPDLVRSGDLPVAVVDRAVRRVLRVKKALGLFDNPYRSMDLHRETADIRLPQAVALAREAAARSIVLLKNDGDLLPLKPSGQKIALIGPFGADDDIMGPWTLFPDKSKGVCVEQGLRAAMGAGAALQVVKGCEVEADIPGGIEAAVAAAKAADVVILAIGESSAMSGEAQARVEIVVPDAQQALAEAVAATGKPVVVLLSHGRALALKGAVRNAQAIVATWFLGSEAGHGIADILFGVQSPSGRLAVSFPQASGQEPFFYDHRATGRPQLNPDEPQYKARYREVTFEALYPFGHGLTYSKIVYDTPKTDRAALAWDGEITISATLTNQGSRKVREVAQLYIHQRVASLTPPVRALKGFQAVEIEPGQSMPVTFKLTRQDLAFVHPNLKTEAEPGLFDVWIAPSSVAGTPTQFTLSA